METTDTRTWAAIEEATRQYEEYLSVQRIADLAAVLRSEQEVQPVPPRTDLPLAFSGGR